MLDYMKIACLVLIETANSLPKVPVHVCIPSRNQWELKVLKTSLRSTTRLISPMSRGPTWWPRSFLVASGNEVLTSSSPLVSNHRKASHRFFTPIISTVSASLGSISPTKSPKSTWSPRLILIRWDSSMSSV